jgi:PleD family two-component response regulator
MPDADARTDPQPLVLVANAEQWFARSLESVLTAHGYRVMRAQTALQTLELARRSRPHAIVIDTHLPESDGIALCRALRGDPAISLATPIVLTTPGPASRAQQLEALRAGAWELRGEPLDAEEFLLRLGAFVQGKVEADRLGKEGLVDRASDLYNAVGLERRAQELASLATRQGLALACVVFRPAGDVLNGAGDRLAQAFKASGRISDAVGRLGPTEFAVFAPATDERGVARLVNRITERVAQQMNASAPDPAQGAVRLRSGYSVVAAPPLKSIEPLDLLARARGALDAARASRMQP